MKTTIKNLFKIFSFIFILSSCGKKAADVLIPEDVAMVLHINAASLSSKLTWDEIKNSEWFKMASKEGPTNDIQKKIMENPESSGIDLKSDMYLYMQIRANNSYVVVQGKIKDVKAFEATIKNVSDKKTEDSTGEIKKEGSFSYMGDEDGCLIWTNDRFIIVGNAGDFQSSQNIFGTRKKIKITIDSILKYTKDLYGLKQKNSITNDKRYASLASEKGDIHFWLNSSSLIKSSMPAGLDLFKAASLLEGNVTGYTVNFENGKITANTKSWFNNELGALMKKYKPGNLNTDMLKRIQGKELSVVFAMNYPPEGLKEFLKLFGVDGMINGFIGEVGLTIDDFVKANKGDLLFAVSDFSVRDTQMRLEGMGKNDFGFSTPRPDANVLFATSINDKPSFDKMIDVLKTQISKNGGAKDLAMIKYTVKDNWFIASNVQESLDGFAAGNTTDHSFIGKISGHPMGGFIDFQKLSSGIKTKQLGGTEKIFTSDNKVWENMVFYGGEMKEGAFVAYMEVNLFDKNTNSLKQINSYMNTVAKTTQEEMNRRMNDFDRSLMDSIPPKPHPLPD